MEPEKGQKAKREEFIKTYESYTKSDISKKILFIQSLQLEKLEQISSNTSKLVWWLVVIPILVFIITLIFIN